MPEGDQERFEDYLELERYLAALQEDRRPPLSAELTPAQARLYRLAALLRAAAPGAADPRPEFVSELRARLERELTAQAAGESEPEQKQTYESAVTPTSSEEPASGPVAPSSASPSLSAERNTRVSRRRLLTGGAVAAASLVAGAGLDRALQQAKGGSSGAASQATPPVGSTGTGAPPTYRPPAYPSLIGADVPSRWHFVTEVSALGQRPVRFVTETIAGYVIRRERGSSDSGEGYGSRSWAPTPDGTTSGEEEIVAFSAACTHMGCLVEWQESDGKFHCPCHGGVFTASGQADPSAGRLRYLAPLPRLDIRIEDGKIYVRIPASGTPS
ncbi:ubiquinol-cytochrome c reductase iron-sulfur subunit [Thermogemmatispora sp.]|uniref:ubiquinol-cytochrome c reductase iron-sulfur subunit n=1 Tax=Thermogemmatispora sp. TaxID=1968838 RepID=UPI0035E45664